MTRMFNPPPNWPQPPIGWSPHPGWRPDPSWGPPPDGWQLWVDSDDEAPRRVVDTSAATPEQRVFISYRRSDCQPQANGLHDGLSYRLKSANIFMDIDSIPPGVDFEQHIRREIEICDLVLVLIGDDWLETLPGTQTRRIDDPDDFVRLEIESALASPRVRIVPVLVEGAQMPRPADLPESIRRLARINAIELSDRRWTADVARLAALVEQIGREEQERAQRSAASAAEDRAPRSGSAEGGRNMRLTDVRESVVLAAVASMPTKFHTKDISENPEVLRAHADVRGLRNYHTMIGRYLATNHGALGLGPAEASVDDRGAIWHKQSASRHQGSAETPSHRLAEPSGAAMSGTSTSASQPRRHQTSWLGWVMVALPALTCGLASFVPALWAASQRWQDRRFRRRMLGFAAVIGVLSVAGFALLVSAPTDAGGTPSGPQSDIGGSIWFTCLIVATVVAVLQRKPLAKLPGAAEELARRKQREQHRNLVIGDPALARSMAVGRPDLERDYSDGGLLDLNSLGADSLSRFGPMPGDEAKRIVEARQQLGRLSSVDEVIVYASPSDSTIARLKETAIFL